MRGGALPGSNGINSCLLPHLEEGMYHIVGSIFANSIKLYFRSLLSMSSFQAKRLENTHAS